MKAETARYLQMDAKGRWILTFGKHKGEFLDDVVSEDSEYLDWFLNQDVSDRVRDIIEHAIESK